jgi:16S rRNA (cytosine1402-N4)-methyltransferase
MDKFEFHQSVLVNEVKDAILSLKKDKDQLKVVDCTLGSAGHSLALAKAGIDVLGVEDDPEMLELARTRIKKEGFEKEIVAVKGNFRNLDQLVKENHFGSVDAIIFDLGVSNIQLMGEKRGFSFSNPASVLDMRLDPVNQNVSAADLLNTLRPDQLVSLFARVLIKFKARQLVRAITNFRSYKKIETVGDFLEICRSVGAKEGLHYATLPFLALRLATNSELENLEEALPKAWELIRSDGLLMVIVFHSKEREIVEKFFQVEKQRGQVAKLSFRVPEEVELNSNPRARSAKLYILKKS